MSQGTLRPTRLVKRRFAAECYLLFCDRQIMYPFVSMESYQHQHEQHFRDRQCFTRDPAEWSVRVASLQSEWCFEVQVYHADIHDFSELPHLL